MAISFDLTTDDIENASQDFTPIPAGIYEVAIKDCIAAKSGSEKNLGKPMYKLTYRIVEGDYEGRQLFNNITLFRNADGSMPFTLMQLLSALDKLPEGGGSVSVPEPHELIGERIAVRVSLDDHYKNAGEKQNNIKRIMASESAPASSGAAGSTKIEFE